MTLEALLAWLRAHPGVLLNVGRLQGSPDQPELWFSWYDPIDGRALNLIWRVGPAGLGEALRQVTAAYEQHVKENLPS